MRFAVCYKPVLFVAFLTAPLFGAPGDRFAAVRAFIREQMAANQTPSVSVAVAQDGQIVWEEAFGWADREKRVEAAPDTMYSLASISKPMTATGLMLLVQQGKINLDWPINSYLGDAKVTARVGDAKDATVRRIANHTSGLPLHYQFFYEDEPYRRPAMDETIRRYANLITLPGERFQYSNLGFGLLDYLISRVSGQNYPDFMRQRVFLPLNLTHTSVNPQPGMEKFQALRYGPDGVPIPFYDFDHAGGSAIYSSAHDLVRFAMFHLKDHLADQKPILKDAWIDAMHQPTAIVDKNRGYGIGWFTEDTASGYRLLEHTGGMGGVSTILQLVPSRNIAVVVLTNANTSLPARVSHEILTVLIPDLYPKQPPIAPDEVQKIFQPSHELAGVWTGTVHTWKADLPFTLEIHDFGDVHARLDKQLETVLNDPHFEDGYLTGRMMGDIGTDDASRKPHFLAVSLKLRGKVLNGAMTAMSQPGKRTGNGLTYWVELKKE